MSEPSHGSIRYRLLETVRQYSRDRLLEMGENDLWRDQHLAYYLKLAEETEPKLTGPDQQVWLDRLEEEHDNLRTALDYSSQWSMTRSQPTEARRTTKDQQPTPEDNSRLTTRDSQLKTSFALRLCGALFPFWRVRGYLSEGREWCTRILGAVEAQSRTPQRAKALYASGILANMQGDYTSACLLLEESRDIFRECGDQHGVAGSLHGLGYTATNQSDYAMARMYYEESLSIRRAIADRNGMGATLHNLGSVAKEQGDNATARTYYEESLSIFREIGHLPFLANALTNLGNVAQSLGEIDRAQTYLEESLIVYRDIADRSGMGAALNNLGGVAYQRGDMDRARAYFEESLSIFREIGYRQFLANSLHGMGNVALSQSDYAMARTYYEESLHIRQETGDRLGIARSLEAFGNMAAQNDGHEQVVVLTGVAQRLREEIDATQPPDEQALFDQWLTIARQALGEETFSAAWAEGQAMTVEQAIEYALSQRSA